jgi:multimeric flavodoxin WrbA
LLRDNGTLALSSIRTSKHASRSIGGPLDRVVAVQYADEAANLSLATPHIRLDARSKFMKIVAVLGSPRPKSNSSALARTILEGASQFGAETREFVLNKLQFKGCQACETCKTKLDHCVLKDDLTAVLEAVQEADVVVLATPNYFGEVSGQFKSFFDRTYSYLNSDFSSRLKPGKTSVFIFAQGQKSLDAYRDVHPRYEMWMKQFGFSTNYLMRMNGPRAAESIAQRPDLVTEAQEIAAKLGS